MKKYTINTIDDIISTTDLNIGCVYTNDFSNKKISFVDACHSLTYKYLKANELEMAAKSYSATSYAAFDIGNFNSNEQMTVAKINKLVKEFETMVVPVLKAENIL